MKGSDAMTIRQMCDMYDVTARTLRFYESKDLLAPVREGQKRLFTKRDRARLVLILRGKRFGLSLDDIQQLLNLYSLGDQGQAQLERSLQVGQTRLDELIQQRVELDQTINELQGLLEKGVTIADPTQKPKSAAA